MARGVLAGYPLTDVEVALYHGSFHEVDSSENAFKVAASMAFQAATKKAKLILLEPIMKLEIVIPEKFLGDIIGNLSARRGRIGETKDRLNTKVVDAKVPLSEMFGYATTIRSLTEGRGNFTMEFSHYEKVPKNITKDIDKFLLFKIPIISDQKLVSLAVLLFKFANGPYLRIISLQ